MSGAALEEQKEALARCGKSLFLFGASKVVAAEPLPNEGVIQAEPAAT